MNVVRNKQLRIRQALYFRKKLHPQEMNEEMKRISSFLKEKSIEHTWLIVSSNLIAEQTTSGYVIEIEIICPIEGEFQSNERYHYLENVLVDNALYVRYDGEEDHLQEAYEELSVYMKLNQLTPIESAYCVTIKEPTTNDTNCIVDIY
ncbi:MAG TPA: hypothetical protein VHO94_05765 [Oscillospiraceae bacterium]|nr:hypothetical protein [Oscillospiraceae bacterium]